MACARPLARRTCHVMWNRELNTSCAFCARETLAPMLAEAEHFFLLADHAPLVEGHLLIIPRAHYACFGALPVDLEDELLVLKARVRAFFVARYQTPAFFEHGVFRQTVPHAHLHALPFGALAVDLPALPEEVEHALAAVFAREERARALRLEGTYAAVLARAIDPELAASYAYVILRPHLAARWTPVLELGNRTEGLDVEISRLLGGCAVFTTFVYGDVVSGYRLARRGAEVDRYASDPTALHDTAQDAAEH